MEYRHVSCLATSSWVMVFHVSVLAQTLDYCLSYSWVIVLCITYRLRKCQTMSITTVHSTMPLLEYTLSTCNISCCWTWVFRHNELHELVTLCCVGCRLILAKCNRHLVWYCTTKVCPDTCLGKMYVLTCNTGTGKKRATAADYTYIDYWKIKYLPVWLYLI